MDVNSFPGYPKQQIAPEFIIEEIPLPEGHVFKNTDIIRSPKFISPYSVINATITDGQVVRVLLKGDKNLPHLPANDILQHSFLFFSFLSTLFSFVLSCISFNRNWVGLGNDVLCGD